MFKDGSMPTGCYVDMVTPFTDCDAVDLGGLRRNIDFVASQGVAGLLLVGTAGESSVLSEEEHTLILKKGIEYITESDVSVLAGTGSNSLREAGHYTKKAQEFGYEGVVVVTPYYNNPPSLYIYNYYLLPLALEFKRLKIFPYIDSMRTGTTLSPEDMTSLDERTGNLCGIVWAEKQAEIELLEVRKKARSDFEIFVAKEDILSGVMADKEIRARGIFSVLANIFPGPVQKMVQSMKYGDNAFAKKSENALSPFYDIIEVAQQRKINDKNIITDYFPVPVTIKVMMSILGMPSGHCRPPLGKMTNNALCKIKDVMQVAVRENYWLFKPIEKFYEVDVIARINNPELWKEQEALL